MAEENQNDITSLTVQLLSAFVSNNTVPSDGLAELIKTTRAALTEEATAPAEPAVPEYVPAVSIRKSLSSPEHILSLIDGKPYKTLKRHLASHGLTEKDYRERYSLPASYPLVAPNYSAARRAVAEKVGLGKKPVAKPAAAPKAAAAKSAAPASPAAAPKPAATTKPAAGSVKTDSKTSAKATAKKPAAAKAPEQKAAAAPKSARAKLSIAAPKDAKSSASAKTEKPTAPVAAKAKTPAAKAAPAKAKAPAKPKTVKAALKAAGDHLTAEGSSATTKG